MTCPAVGGDLEIALVARDNAGAIRLRFIFTNQRECLLPRSSVTTLERSLRLLRVESTISQIASGSDVRAEGPTSRMAA
jgi:hypothetical protein